jgi:hypothetical protein
LLFGITLYGVAVLPVLLGLWWLADIPGRADSWPVAIFLGSVAAFLLSAHLAIALLSGVGVVVLVVAKVARALRSGGGLQAPPRIWRRIAIASSVLLVATVVWAEFTGHSLGVPASPPIVGAFAPIWLESVAITILGGGVFFAIAIAWLAVRDTDHSQADLYVAALAVVAAGAVGWGARLGEFTMFYLFYGAIGVIATPIAAIAAWMVWTRARALKRRTLAAAMAAFFVIQLEFGAVNAVLRMQVFGPHDYAPIPTGILDSIRALPPGSKLAYACQPLEELGFGTPQLLSIDAHTGQRVVPLCFQAEFLSGLIGAERSERVENLYFKTAPQRELFPTADARPSPDLVAAFMRRQGIDYIYADAKHPNTLVPDAVPVASAGDVVILRLPV